MTTAAARSCPICFSQILKEYPFGYSFNNRWLQAVGCTGCGIIFITPQPMTEEIEKMYSREYFEGDFRCGHAGSYFDDVTLRGIVDYSMLEKIRIMKPKGKFLEIGCAGGAFLNAAKSYGYEVHGVEVSSDAAEFARSKFGLKVFVGDVVSAKFPDGFFDVVFMADVLEHLKDPRSTLAEIHRIMNKGALLIVICPTQTNTLFSRTGFFMYSVLGRQAAVQLPPYHLFEYRPDSLKYFLERCGFTIVMMKGSSIPPGDLALRGTGLQRIGKKIFQYPNYILTKVFGIYGDRIEMFARKGELSH